MFGTHFIIYVLINLFVALFNLVAFSRAKSTGFFGTNGSLVRPTWDRSAQPGWFFGWGWLFNALLLAFTYAHADDIATLNAWIAVFHIAVVLLHMVWAYVFFIQRKIRMAWLVALALVAASVISTFYMCEIHVNGFYASVLSSVWAIVIAVYNWQTVQLNPNIVV